MKTVMPILMGILMLSILSGANIYLARRFSYFFNIEQIKFMYIGFAALTVFMIGSLIGLSNSVSSIGNVLYVSAASLLGYTLYLLFAVLLVDLGGLFLNFTPKVFGLTALVLAFLVVGYGMINAFNVRSNEHEVKMAHLAEEVKLVHWSDVHIGHFRGERFLNKLVEQTNELDPDIIVITGDMFDGRIHLMSSTLRPMEKLRAPVYFVEGNHDKYSGVAKVKELMKQAGVRVLEDEVIEEKGIQLVGLNHMLADNKAYDMHANGYGPTINNVLAELEIDKLKPSILLHHSPDGMKYASQAGIDLYLSGHTHGGQQFPVTILNNYLFPYNKGFSEYEGTKIFVSMGVGTFGPPLRVGAQGEVVLLRLGAEERHTAVWRYE